MLAQEIPTFWVSYKSIPNWKHNRLIKHLGQKKAHKPNPIYFSPSIKFSHSFSLSLSVSLEENLEEEEVIQAGKLSF